MRVKGRIVDLMVLVDGKQRLTIETRDDLRATVDQLREDEISAEIKKWHKGRSLSANAYFHVLVNKIASVLRTSDEEVKQRLAVEYGTVATAEDGSPYVVQIPASADIGAFYPYHRLYRTIERNGTTWHCYLLYKHTHTMDSTEMARLIDGTVSEAKALEIETLPPDDIKALEAMWKENDR